MRRDPNDPQRERDPAEGGSDVSRFEPELEGAAREAEETARMASSSRGSARAIEMSPPQEQRLPDAQPSAAPSGTRARARGRTESALVRVAATLGIVGVATAVAAIEGSQDVAAWTIGLTASLITLILTGLLWARTPARRSRV